MRRSRARSGRHSIIMAAAGKCPRGSLNTAGHDLKEQHVEDAAVQEWFTQVKALYERARAYRGPDPSLPPAKRTAVRMLQQHALEQELWQLCTPYAHTPSPL